MSCVRTLQTLQTLPTLLTLILTFGLKIDSHTKKAVSVVCTLYYDSFKSILSIPVLQ